MQSRYFITGGDDGEYGEYSADPADYWMAADDAPVGLIVKKSHRYRTVTGQTIYAERVIKTRGTVRDLRRLAAAMP